MASVANKTFDVKLIVAVSAEALPELSMSAVQCCTALTGIKHFPPHIRSKEVSFSPRFRPKHYSIQCLSKLERFRFVAECVSACKALHLNQTGEVFVLA